MKAGKISHKPRYGGEGTGLGGGSGESMPQMSPRHKSTEHDPTRHEVPVASFSKGTQRGPGACLHFKVHSSSGICLHPSAPSHPLEVPEGPRCYPYGTDGELCLLVPELPSSHSVTLCKWQARGACSPSGYPEESLLDNPTFLWETVKGATRKHLQSPPHPPVCSGKQSCYINY